MVSRQLPAATATAVDSRLQPAVLEPYPHEDVLQLPLLGLGQGHQGGGDGVQFGRGAVRLVVLALGLGQLVVGVVVLLVEEGEVLHVLQEVARLVEALVEALRGGRVEPSADVPDGELLLQLGQSVLAGRG